MEDNKIDAKAMLEQAQHAHTQAQAAQRADAERAQQATAARERRRVEAFNEIKTLLEPLGKLKVIGHDQCVQLGPAALWVSMQTPPEEGQISYAVCLAKNDKQMSIAYDSRTAVANFVALLAETQK